MLRTKLAKTVLTKAEQRHLTEDGNIHSMKAFERQIAFMKKCDKPWRVCRECWSIAKKLGMVPDSSVNR